MNNVQPKRMLMFGPGYGHNVEAKLRTLNETTLFDVVFIAYQFDEVFRTKYPNITYIPSLFIIDKKQPWKTLKSFWWLYKQVRCTGHYDVVYSLGMSWIMGALIFFFAKKETRRAYEMWSIHIIESAKERKGLAGRLDAYMLKRADYVCQYWWGIRERFVKTFPEYEQKFVMYPLSYPDIFFSGEKHIAESEFVKSFLAKIPHNQIVCFWPRSFIPSNNHPLLLESLGIIKRRNAKLLDNFKLYLWGGNVEDESRIQLIKGTIAKNNLQDNVEIVEHPFVPQNDIFAIEERSDFFVQIANDDILSTFIMEILCSGKPFVLSNLKTFRFLNEKYKLNVELTDNDESLISDKIESIIKNLLLFSKKTDFNRREQCRKFFSKVNTKPSFQILYEAL